MLGLIDAATLCPISSWTSAITMALAPWMAKWRAVASPMPLAPPVTMATLPWSLFFGVVESVISFVCVNQVIEYLCYVKKANYLHINLSFVMCYSQERLSDSGPIHTKVWARGLTTLIKLLIIKSRANKSSEF